MATLNKAATQPLGLNEVSAFFNRRYSHNNGFALENLGRVTATERNSWPQNNSGVLLQPSWIYTPSTTGSSATATEVGGSVRFGRDVRVTTTNTGVNSRVDLDYEVHSFAEGQSSVDITFAVLDEDTGNSTLFFASRAVSTLGRGTITTDDPTSLNRTISSGNRVKFLIQVSDATRGADISVHGIRFSFNEGATETELELVGRFPDAGGFALSRLGEASENGASSWPNGQGWVEGADITYTPTNVSVGTTDEVASVITNNGPPVDLTNARVQIDFTITAVGPATVPGIIPSILIRKNGITAFNATTPSAIGLGSHTFRDDSLSAAVPQANRTWQTGESIDIYMNETGDEFTYTVDQVRFSFTSTDFVRNNLVEELSNFNRGGRVVPRNGPVTFDYPSTGGLAMTNWPTTVRLEHSGTQDTGWPTDTPTQHGDFSNWIYNDQSIAVVSSRLNVDNSLINDSGAAITASTMRLDIDYNISNIDPNDDPANLRIRIFAGYVTSPSGDPSTTQRFSFIAGAGDVVVGDNTARLVVASGQDFTMQDGQGVAFYVTETTDSEGIPYTVTINAVRLSFTTDEYNQTTIAGPALNTGVSTDTTTVTLASLRGVDDGVD